jgi:non-ribosomal peptide synthetase component F
VQVTCKFPARLMLTTSVRTPHDDPMVATDVRLTARCMTASDQLARHARKIPDQTAMRFNGSGLSYRELDERVTRLANALTARGVGVGVGDRVAVLGMSSWRVTIASSSPATSARVACH